MERGRGGPDGGMGGGRGRRGGRWVGAALITVQTLYIVIECNL